jgi:hypothetical protein
VSMEGRTDEGIGQESAAKVENGVQVDRRVRHKTCYLYDYCY